jgi:HEAT repeat protein
VGQKSGKGISATWIEAAGELVLRSSEKPEPGVQAGALRLALVLLRQDRPAQEIVGKAFVSACRTLAEAGLQAEDPGARTAAVRVASLPELGLLSQVAPLALGPKRDPHAEVRSLALTAIAAHEDIAPTEELLPLLHDADPEVRATCEHALRGRGLTGPHVQLARQMSDPQAQVRARVPAQVSRFSELDARLWLDRLSRDPSPAVRAAVLRAAAEVDQEQLLERLEAMADSDPSPTVRQIANYYLRAR